MNSCTVYGCARDKVYALIRSDGKLARFSFSRSVLKHYGGPAVAVYDRTTGVVTVNFYSTNNRSSGVVAVLQGNFSDATTLSVISGDIFLGDAKYANRMELCDTWSNEFSGPFAFEWIELPNYIETHHYCASGNMGGLVGVHYWCSNYANYEGTDWGFDEGTFDCPEDNQGGAFNSNDTYHGNGYPHVTWEFKPNDLMKIAQVFDHFKNESPQKQIAWLQSMIATVPDENAQQLLSIQALQVVKLYANNDKFKQELNDIRDRIIESDGTDPDLNKDLIRTLWFFGVDLEP